MILHSELWVRLMWRSEFSCLCVFNKNQCVIFNLLFLRLLVCDDLFSLQEALTSLHLSVYLSAAAGGEETCLGFLVMSNICRVQVHTTGRYSVLQKILLLNASFAVKALCLWLIYVTTSHSTPLQQADLAVSFFYDLHFFILSSPNTVTQSWRGGSPCFFQVLRIICRPIMITVCVQDLSGRGKADSTLLVLLVYIAWGKEQNVFLGF